MINDKQSANIQIFFYSVVNRENFFINKLIFQFSNLLI